MLVCLIYTYTYLTAWWRLKPICWDGTVPVSSCLCLSAKTPVRGVWHFHWLPSYSDVGSTLKHWHPQQILYSHKINDISIFVRPLRHAVTLLIYQKLPKGCRLKNKKAQPKSWGFCFIWRMKLRTLAQDTTSQTALRGCSQEAKGEPDSIGVVATKAR